MKEEKIIQYLKNANFWGNENIYFYTVACEKLSKNESVYDLDVLSIKYYIVNRNENGIGIIPFNELGKSIKNLITFIPNSDIKEVYIEDYKFLFFIPGKKLIIKTIEDKVIELEYTGNVNKKNYSLNMYNFLTSFNN